MPALSPLIARACAVALDAGDAVWDQLAVELAVSALKAADALTRAEPPASAAA
jgi:AraC family transcriptional regulator